MAETDGWELYVGTDVDTDRPVFSDECKDALRKAVVSLGAAYMRQTLAHRQDETNFYYEGEIFGAKIHITEVEGRVSQTPAVKFYEELFPSSLHIKPLAWAAHNSALENGAENYKVNVPEALERAFDGTQPTKGEMFILLMARSALAEAHIAYHKALTTGEESIQHPGSGLSVLQELNSQLNHMPVVRRYDEHNQPSIFELALRDCMEGKTADVADWRPIDIPEDWEVHL